MTQQSGRVRFILVLVVCSICISVCVQAEREERDQDDFDDSGFDDSGYNSPQSHEAEGTQHNPSSYSPSSEEDLDDDDDADESNNVANVANLGSRGPQRFYSPANSIVMPISMSHRQKRSISNKEENDIEDLTSGMSAKPLVRKRRYSKGYIGPVYTYVKTDKHAHYKWGVKHKVGKHYG